MRGKEGFKYSAYYLSWIVRNPEGIVRLPLRLHAELYDCGWMSTNQNLNHSTCAAPA
jgi:hypothetical protein